MIAADGSVEGARQISRMHDLLSGGKVHTGQHRTPAEKEKP